MAENDRQWRSGGGDTSMAVIGQNMVVAINNLSNIVSASFPNLVSPPANSSASGVAGQFAISGTATTSSYIYACLTSGSNGNAVWGRALLTTSF